jgi:PTH1 family peptidyl-tRNA hydrolase
MAQDTYMNLSGKAVRYWAQKLKILPENMLVIVDDLNLDFGALRLRGKGSHGGHNGLKDIEEKLNSNAYSRLRIGIGNDFRKGRQVDYVLGKWDEGQKAQLGQLIQFAATAVLDYSTMGLKMASEANNRKKI